MNYLNSPQESTSTYFNSIVRDDVKPLSVDDLSQEVVEKFNEKVRLAFTDDADATIRRVKYLIPYILQSIDWNEYGIPLEAWQLQYYYRRNRFLERTRLSYEKFATHQPLQDAIRNLHLDSEATFEFILFLKYYFGMRSELRYSSVEQLQLAQSALQNLESGKDASIDISVGGKHFKIANTQFVKEAICMIDCQKLKNSSFINEFNEGSSREKIRAIDYYLVKTLLDYLPIKREPNRNNLYNQNERNFGLSVLSYIGRLPDIDRDGTCSKENNATFDKLMRDFNGTRIPFAMELFL
jgi:hypothetical protein